MQNTQLVINVEGTAQLGEVSEIWDKSLKLEKKNHLFFLETSLVHLGASPDTIGKIS